MSTVHTYIALGDSYTIGEAVEQNDSFPHQLVSLLQAKGIPVEAPVVIAKTGWTTSELQEAIENAALSQKFNIVTLLIGVNNQYRGESKEQYREEFNELLQTAVDFVGGDQTKVFVVSIPDWGVTAYGQKSGRNSQTIAAEIDEFNAINRELSLSRGLSYTDITPASRLAVSDQELTASDELHPSGKMYLDWATQLAPIVAKTLN